MIHCSSSALFGVGWPGTVLSHSEGRQGAHQPHRKPSRRLHSNTCGCSFHLGAHDGRGRLPGGLRQHEYIVSWSVGSGGKNCLCLLGVDEWSKTDELCENEKVKSGAYTIAGHGHDCSVHLRTIGPLSLQWIRTHYCRTLANVKSRIATVYSPQFPHAPFCRPT